MRTRSTPPPNAGQLPRLSTIAALSFLAGILLWFGGSCLVLGGGSDNNKSDRVPVVAPKSTSASPAQGGGAGTPLPDRTSCNEIRGTQYRSDAERAWFQANCIQTPEPPPTTPPTTPTVTATPTRVP